MRTLKEKYDIIENLHRQKVAADLQLSIPFGDKKAAIKNLAIAMAEVTKMYLAEMDEAINPVSEISAPILIGSMEAMLSSLKDSYPDAAKEAKKNKIGEAIKKGITSTINVDITNIFKDVNGGRV